MDKKYVKKILSQQFPKTKYKLLGEGYDNWVYEIGGKTLIRIPKTPLYKKKLLQEVQLLELLSSKSPLSIPEYTLVAIDGSFGVYEKIIGKPLTLKTYRSLKPKIQNKIAVELGFFISTLHSLPAKQVSKLGFIDYKSKNPKTEYTKRRKTIHSVLNKKESKAVDTIQTQFFTLPKHKKKVLVHHDLSDEHILLSTNNKKITGIIDFSDASFADPALDFAWIWELGEEFVHEVYKNYTHKDETFLERSRLFWFQNILSQIYHHVKNQKKTVSHPIRHLRYYLKTV